MSKVSIIMPVYNAERYLGEAIESVLKQTYSDFELLLINDASTDRSKEICMDYCKQDDRLVLLENNSEVHGPGPTRNIGLEHATGEFLYCMDADDWIEDCLLQCAVDRMQETNADIVQFGVIFERDDGVHGLQYCWSGKDVLTKEEIKEGIIHFLKEYRYSLWLHFFRRETVKTIRFENITIGEDVSYVIDALGNAGKIAFIADKLYHYRYVEGSTSHRWVENTIECRIIIWKHQKCFLDAFHVDIDPLVYADVAYRNYIWAIYQLSSSICSLSFREKRKQLRKLGDAMEFEKYRGMYPLDRQCGIERIKYGFVKHRLEEILLRFGPLFLRIVRGG